MVFVIGDVFPQFPQRHIQCGSHLRYAAAHDVHAIAIRREGIAVLRRARTDSLIEGERLPLDDHRAIQGADCPVDVLIQRIRAIAGGRAAKGQHARGRAVANTHAQTSGKQNKNDSFHTETPFSAGFQDAREQTINGSEVLDWLRMVERG